MPQSAVDSLRLRVRAMHVCYLSNSLTPEISRHLALSYHATLASPQVFGAEQLLKQSSAAPLAMTKVFSSLAAFSGSGGQGSYASANGVLDSWAAVSQAR